MKYVRRNWPLVIVVSVFGVLGASAWLLSPALRAQEGGGVTQLASADWFAMRATFNQAGLSSSNLTAINVTAAQADSVLSTARQWCETNAATLSTQRADVGAKRTALRIWQQKVAAGPRNDQTLASLATAGQELATAEGQLTQTLGGLVSAVDPLLSASQRSLWAVLRANERLPMPDRLLSLTDPERNRLAWLRRSYAAKLAEAETATERDQVREWYSSGRDGVLTDNHRQMIASYGAYAESSSVSVHDGWKTEVPLSDS